MRTTGFVLWSVLWLASGVTAADRDHSRLLRTIEAPAGGQAADKPEGNPDPRPGWIRGMTTAQRIGLGAALTGGGLALLIVQTRSYADCTDRTGGVSGCWGPLWGGAAGGAIGGIGLNLLLWSSPPDEGDSRATLSVGPNGLRFAW